MVFDVSPGAAQVTRSRRSIPAPEVLSGSDFTDRDLSLCSTEEARSFLSCTEALSVSALPLALLRGAPGLTLHVAVADASPEKRETLQFITGLDVTLTEAPREIVHRAISLAYLGSEERLGRALDRVRTSDNAPHDDSAKRGAIAQQEQEAELEPRGDAAQFITALLEFAAVRGASDLHLVPGIDGAIIKMRVNGDLLTQKEKPYAKRFHDQVVSRLKVMASLDISSKLIPHDGALSIPIAGERRHARVSTLPTLHGESVVVRFLANKEVPDLKTLAMEPEALRILRRAMQRTEGIVLLTGPTGSGKTTTMYGVILELDRQGRNVVTVEDPVETPISGMVQVQVALEQGLDYPRAIRSVLRHDPDVLLIGEIRDAVSASIALDAASTGHLTLASLHVGSALHVVSRLEILGVPRARSVPPIALIINQRLIPKLCGACKEVCEEMGSRSGQSFYRRRGCDACRDTGFDGRVLLTEVVDLQTQRAKDACYKAQTASELLELLPNGSYISWTESLQYHLSNGTISIEQVEQFAGSEW